MTVRDIYYVKELEAHMMPGRNGTITVLLKKEDIAVCVVIPHLEKMIGALT